MGCAQSRIENEESVCRCKERRNFMKEAVSVRNAFASAHSGYSISLKDTGAALSDYAQGEVPPPPPEAPPPPDHPASERPPPPPPPPPMEPSLPPPPPPLPSFSPMPPLKRAVTMPAALLENTKEKMKGIAIEESDIEEEDEEDDEEEKLGFRRRKKGAEEGDVERIPIRPPPNPTTTPPGNRGMAWDYFFMDDMPTSNPDEVEEEEDGYEGKNGNLDRDFENAEFRTPEKLKQVGFDGIEEFKTPDEILASAEKHFVHSNTAPPAMSRFVSGENVVGNINNNNNNNNNNNKNGVDLLKILSEVDDHFLKAYQSAQEVSKMLEATRLHYHSNFADNRGDDMIS